MNVHQPIHFGCNTSAGNSNSVNSLLFANGNVGDMPMRMLVDSGAAISVVRNDVLSDSCRKKMTMAQKTAVGANGLPLKIMGQVAVKISLGTFQAIQTLAVVQDLTFECILGADFLSGNKAVMDFRTNTLHLGNHTTITVPASQTVGAQVSDAIHNISIHAPEDLQVPARSVRLVNGMLPSGFCREAGVEEGLVEPAAVGLPKHLCVARSLGKVSSNGSVLLQVMNVSPTTVTVYKGTTLAEFVPTQEHSFSE